MDPNTSEKSTREGLNTTSSPYALEHSTILEHKSEDWDIASAPAPSEALKPIPPRKFELAPLSAQERIASEMDLPPSIGEQKIGIEQDPSVITHILESAVTLESILRKPNIQEDAKGLSITDQIMKIVNGDDLAVHQSSLGSVVVKPETLQILIYNGKLQVVGPGRWLRLNPRAMWGPIVPLKDTICHESLSIIQVGKGQIGLALYRGFPVLLDEGWHVYNDRYFVFKNCVPAMEKIQFETISAFRVPQGKYALVEEKNIPKILMPGFYVVDSEQFRMHNIVDIYQTYIKYQTLHVITVKKSEIHCIWIGTKPELLYEGVYIINSPLLTREERIYNVTDNLIQHGTITRIRVDTGKLATLWYKNIPQFQCTPGVYTYNDSQLKFDSFHDVNENFIHLGTRMRIIVCQGQVGICYVRGKLEILQPNTYMFNSVDRTFSGFLSTKEQCIKLAKTKRGEDDGFLQCETRELVVVGIKASVFFHIRTPEFALVKLGDEKAIHKIVQESSIAALQSIVKSSALVQLGHSKMIQVNDPKFSAGDSGHFTNHIHEEFMKQLYHSFLAEYGIEISNIRIEDYNLMNEDLTNSISKQVIETSQTETKLANLKGQKEIAVQEQERQAEVNRIKSEAENQQIRLKVQAQNDAIILEAKTKAESMELLAQAESKSAIIKAQSEAEAVRIRARAEAEAIQIKAEAEKKRMEALGSSEFGKEMVRAEVQSNMVVRSLQGVEKICYIPPDANMPNYLLQMYGLQQSLAPQNACVKK